MVSWRRAWLVVVLAVFLAGHLVAGQGPVKPAGAGGRGRGALGPWGDDWQVVVLGIAQDGGIPQLGCVRPICQEIRSGTRPAEKVSSLGLVNRRTGDAYVFDATPDLPAQLERLTGGRVPTGIFLTHAHIGHYTGLMFLGRESVNASRVPVFATERMGAFLRANGPWSQLVAIENIVLQTLSYDRAVTLDGGVRVTAFAVPHRDEFSDTVGYRLDGPRRSALFIPDIDRWEKWNRDIRALADTRGLCVSRWHLRVTGRDQPAD